MEVLVYYIEIWSARYSSLSPSRKKKVNEVKNYYLKISNFLCIYFRRFTVNLLLVNYR